MAGQTSILDTFKAKLNSEWKYRACHWHNAKSQGVCLRPDSENGEWVTHCCTKYFYHTAEIIKWMLLIDGQTGQTNAAALLSAAQDSVYHMRNQPGRFGASDLGKGDRRCYIVFAILLNLDCGSLIHTFQRYGITDGNLSNERLSNLDTLKEELPGSASDVNKLVSNFDDMRFMFQHVVMDLHTPTVYSDRQKGRWISPFCRRQLINNKGGTAKVWQVSVQDRFLSLGLQDRLKRSEYNDPLYGKCYSMALKTFTSEYKHVFNREKLNYSAVEGLAGMVQYLGEYEVDEEIDGQGVDRTWNLLLEFGDLDLEELFFSPKDPPGVFETIVEFWEALSKVAAAVERIHNLEAHRDRGDSVRYHGWHADIKPDNILRVRDEFKLADLGFAKFSLKDETGSEPKAILTGLTETYGKGFSSFRQKIDIWSLGCVFSVAATWVILGRQGVSVYEKLRQNAINKLRSPQSERQPTAADAFHDGHEILRAVTDWHSHLRSSVRKSDSITPKILDLIDDEMLRREPQQRIPSCELIFRFAEGIAAARSTHALQADRGNLRPLSDDIKNAIRQVEEEAELLTNIDGEGDTASLPPEIVIGEHQVESPELMPDNSLEGQPKEYQPLEEATTPKIEATTQRAHAGALSMQDSIKTHGDPNAGFAQDQTTLRNKSYIPGTPPKNRTRPQSTEGLGGLYITTTSPPSSSQGERVPRTNTRNGFDGLPTQFQLDPNWSICRQLESIRKKSLLKHLLGGNDKYLSSFLVNRDIKFVIDNGGSMRPYWPAMRIALETLASMIGRLDKDGLDIEFTLGKEIRQARDEALRPQDPQMVRTDMAMILGQIFQEYLKDTSKPMTLIVFTDGIWEGTYSLQDVETSIVEFLRDDAISKKFSNLRWFSIEFVSFGQAGVGRLEGLDDDLESKYKILDVIDHEPVSGDVYKMILGSLNKTYDVKPSNASPVADTASLSPGSPHSATESPMLPPFSRQNSTLRGNRLSRMLGRN
ncbi:hypothetical protein PG994_001741 [Apiospora phragmitis]|uniref:Protein kinase domain-containing protein n=1 Tax=Apiospora phragmitis TaxID=2905665 RepID=A0ABR1WUD7_9PEZI